MCQDPKLVPTNGFDYGVRNLFRRRAFFHNPFQRVIKAERGSQDLPERLRPVPAALCQARFRKRRAENSNMNLIRSELQFGVKALGESDDRMFRDVVSGHEGPRRQAR